jgi:hypothetical protein
MWWIEYGGPGVLMARGPGRAWFWRNPLSSAPRKEDAVHCLYIV